MGGVLQRIFSLCLGVFVVRPVHTDFATKAQSQKYENEIVALSYPWKTAKNPFCYKN